MATAIACDVTAGALRVVFKTEPGTEGETKPELDAVCKRDPVISLVAPISGSRPITWSQDHRVAVSTSNAVSLIELVCDVHSNKQDIKVHRTSLPVQQHALQLQVGPVAELARAKETFASHPDPAVNQRFMADRVINPGVGTHKGVKYTSWSPLGCDGSGRCLLACLSLDHRLTVHNSLKQLKWNLLADLTDLYASRLAARGYSAKDGKPPEANLLHLEELRRRFRMQTPLRMEWSGIYTVKKVGSDNVCREVVMVLLAVLMENGDLVLWQFDLPFSNGKEVTVYDVIESGVSEPSDLAWWEYEGGDRRMSGLIIGSAVGPVKIMPVSLTGVKGYFTLRKPVVLWQEIDQIPVENIKCVPIFHPIRKSNCSLVVASRGCYVFWCLLMISPAGLNVHNSHIAGVHSLPIVSMAATRQGVTIYTCSMDGEVKKLVPRFTESTVVFNQERLLQADSFPGRRMKGIAVSPNGAYLALASTHSMVGGHHPVHRSYQVNFVSVKTARAAAALLLKSSSQSLYKLADLLDLVRWKVVKDKAIVPALMEEVDGKIQESDSLYFWRFKLFLLRILFQALQKAPADPRSRLFPEDAKVFLVDEEEEEEDASEGGGQGTRDVKEEAADARKADTQAELVAVEAHLIREQMKKVLGDVYLNTWTAVNTSIPTCGLVDYLSREAGDRTAEVLIGHIKKKINKQNFLEHCSLCVEVLPFTDHKQATCKNGHMWLRCALSYQTCQKLGFKRCLLSDNIAAEPDAGAPEWIKKILNGSCTFCDSPMI